MHVTRHRDLDAFIAAAAPMKARGEASASFFEGGAHALKRTPASARERLYLASCRGRGAFGIAMMRDRLPLLIGESDAAAAAAFAVDIANDWPELPGVIGAQAGCEAFARKWQDLTGRGHRLRVRMRQHALSAVSDVPAAAGGARTATMSDADWLIECQLAFVVEADLHDRPERVREQLPPRIAHGDFRIWEDRGPVAYAGYNDAAPDFARIAPVYTLPEARGRGYATALVAGLCRELLARGKRKLFLTTDVANPTSNAIYARIGFRAENDDCGLDFIAEE